VFGLEATNTIKKVLSLIRTGNLHKKWCLQPMPTFIAQCLFSVVASSAIYRFWINFNILKFHFWDQHFQISRNYQIDHNLKIELRASVLSTNLQVYTTTLRHKLCNKRTYIQHKILHYLCHTYCTRSWNQ
jgi:hypothetical protein